MATCSYVAEPFGRRLSVFKIPAGMQLCCVPATLMNHYIGGPNEREALELVAHVFVGSGVDNLDMDEQGNVWMVHTQSC